MAKRRTFGHIKKLPSGRFHASYLLGNGKRVNAPDTFKLKRDAEKWLATVEADKVRGILRQPKGQKRTLTEYSAFWVENRPRPLAPSSKEQYELMLRKHILPELGDFLLTEVDRETVRKWHAALARGSQSTAGNAYKILSAIMNTAAKDQLIFDSPCHLDHARRTKEKKRELLSVDEIRTIAGAVLPRYRALVLLAATAGLRYGEFIGLRRQDLDLIQGKVTVEWQLQRIDGEWKRIRPKSDAGIRVLELLPFVVDALRDHLKRFVMSKEPSACLFRTSTGGVPYRAHVRQMLMNAGKKIGKPEIFPHLLRHFALTTVAQAGATNAELMEIGGHTSIQVAMKYQHAAQQRQREIANRINDVWTEEE